MSLHTLIQASDQTKIGFTPFGGVFVGCGINSEFAKHYAITVIVSLDNDFTIQTPNETFIGKLALIQKNTKFKFSAQKNAHATFIHILPYSDLGRSLTTSTPNIQILNIDRTRIISTIQNWYKTGGSSDDVLPIFESLTCLRVKSLDSSPIDPRIAKAFALIQTVNLDTIHTSDIASNVGLSESHFNRLFKKETELAFRKYVLHMKLIRAIHTMAKNENLTTAAMNGDFSDQAHFSRTFKSNFGIKPSKTIN